MAKNILNLPVLPMKIAVAFPYLLFNLDVSTPLGLAAIEHAENNGKRMLLLTQTHLETPKNSDDFYNMGVIADIKQVMKMPNGNVRVFFSSEFRGLVKKLSFDDGMISAKVQRIPNKRLKNTKENEALFRAASGIFKQYANEYKRVPHEALVAVLNASNLSELADIIGATVLSKIADQQQILDEIDPKTRLEKAITLMHRELDMLDLEVDLVTKLHEKMSKENREHYLREQVEIIKKELGEEDEDVAIFRNKLANIPQGFKKKVEKEISKLETASERSPEKEWIRSYLENIFDLPWNEQTYDGKMTIQKAEKVLDKDHYGLVDVKKRILEFLAVRKLTTNQNSQILCLVGSPGIGKTSISRSIAEAMGRKFVRVSLGGVRDEAEIKGHRRTYVASKPGRIIAALQQAGTNNPVILLDEIDKMQADLKGDPTAALLEVLDAEQNKAFRDSYLELPFDLSNTLFIATANNLDNIPKPLRDRMEIVKLDSYTAEEKENIAVKYLVPKQISKNGVDGLKIQKSAVVEIINYYTRESGVRELERSIGKICQQYALELAKNEVKYSVVNAKNLNEYLGTRKFSFDLVNKQDEIGVANGLAWTEVGGETLAIESNILDGTGKIEITGKLGEIMQESAKVAISYVRSKLPEMDINIDFAKKDIHIHVPEGATPKDGPSAGIGIAISVLSTATNIPIRRDVAMTGEVTIRGRVLPIGGLKEKSIAAHRMGISKVIIPSDNLKDIEKIPAGVTNSIEFIPVSTMDEVVAHALNFKGAIASLNKMTSIPQYNDVIWEKFNEHK